MEFDMMTKKTGYFVDAVTKQQQRQEKNKKRTLATSTTNRLSVPAKNKPATIQYLTQVRDFSASQMTYLAEAQSLLVQEQNKQHELLRRLIENTYASTLLFDAAENALQQLRETQQNTVLTNQQQSLFNQQANQEQDAANSYKYANHLLQQEMENLLKNEAHRATFTFTMKQQTLEFLQTEQQIEDILKRGDNALALDNLSPQFRSLLKRFLAEQEQRKAQQNNLSLLQLLGVFLAFGEELNPLLSLWRNRQQLNSSHLAAPALKPTSSTMVGDK